MKQYSFYSVDLLINSTTINGYADGNSIITAARSMPQHGKVMDARGKMVAITSADKSGVMTFDLLQTSDQNSFLQRLAGKSHEDGTSGNSATFIPIQATLVDKMGNTTVKGVNGFLTMQPAVVRGTGLSTVTWLMEFEQLIFVERGLSATVGI